MRSSQTQDQSGGERQQFEQGVHRDGFRAEFSLSFPKLKGFAFQVKKFVKQKKELDDATGLKLIVRAHLFIRLAG